MRRRRTKKWLFPIYVGIGLLLASFCTPQFLVGVLSVVLIILGISYNRC